MHVHVENSCTTPFFALIQILVNVNICQILTNCINRNINIFNTWCSHQCRVRHLGSNLPHSPTSSGLPPTGSPLTPERLEAESPTPTVTGIEFVLPPSRYASTFDVKDNHKPDLHDVESNRRKTGYGAGRGAPLPRHFGARLIQ